jgi:hypothetical protein
VGGDEEGGWELVLIFAITLENKKRLREQVNRQQQ